MMRRPSARRPGFALLITLVALALAAVILALGARRTTTATRVAMQAERDLKRKCALAAGDLFLAKANQFLTSPQSGKPQPVPIACFHLELSGQRVEVLLADEQAKPNLNVLAARLPESDLNLLIERLGGAHAVPAPDPDVPFWCLEQLRPGSMPAALLGGPWPDPTRPSLASAATLWGNGKLHWRTASPAALSAVLGPEVPPDKAQALVSAQQAAGDAPAAALDAATSRWTSKEKAILQARTTDKAQAWSAWVAVGGRQTDDQPTCYRLTLLTRDGDRSTWRRQEWNPVP